MSTKDRFEELVKSYGFANITQFSIAVGIAASNIYSNLSGNSWRMSMSRMFKIANTLKCPVEEVIQVLYPNEYAENQQISRCN